MLLKIEMDKPDDIKNEISSRWLNDMSWMLADETTNDFFNFLKENLTSENILSEEELNEFEQIENVLTESQLKEEISKINSNFPGIVDYTAGDLQKCQFEAGILDKISDEYKSLIDDTSKANCSLDQELLELEHEIQIAKAEEQKCFNDLFEKSVILQDLENGNQKMISDLQDVCTKPQFPPIFISQMSLEKYTLKCQLFTQSLDEFFKNNFKILGNLEFDEDSSNQYLELQKLLKFFKNAELKLFETKSSYEAQKNIIKTLSDFSSSWRPMSFANMRKETKGMEAENVSRENYKSILNDQMQLLINEMQEQKIELSLYENTKVKFEKASQRFEMIQKICPIVYNILSFAEIVWILMQLDMELFESISQSNNNNGLSQSTIDASKRIDAMTAISQKNHQKDFNKKLIDEISKILSPKLISLSKKDFNSIKILLDLFADILSDNKEMLKSILYKMDYQTKLGSISEKLNEKSEILLKFLYTGPTVKLEFYDPIFYEQFVNAKIDLESIKDNFGVLRRDLNELNDVLANDLLKRLENKLWIWFLTEPKKVLSAIKDASNAAKKKASTADQSFAIPGHQMGIKRWDN